MKIIIKASLITLVCRILAYGSIEIQPQSTSSNLFMFIFYLLEFIILVILFRRENTKNVWTTCQYNAISLLTWGAFICFIFFCYLVAEENYLQLVQGNIMQEFPFRFNVFSILSLGIFGPLSEEILFRGFLLNTLSKKFPFWISNLIQAFIFGIIHIDLAVVICALTFGVILGYIRKYSNICFSVLIHALNNLITCFEGLYGFNFLVRTKNMQLTAAIFFNIVFIVSAVFLRKVSIHLLKNRNIYEENNIF